MRKIGVTIKVRNSCMNNSVEALIPFNGGHQGLLKLHVHLMWGYQYGGRGLCYVALLQRSPVSADFDYGNLIFGIWCYSVMT